MNSSFDVDTSTQREGKEKVHWTESLNEKVFALSWTMIFRECFSRPEYEKLPIEL